MFGIDFSEILVIFGIALVVLGPEKLPKLANTIGRWIGRARSMARQFREQLEQEAGGLRQGVDHLRQGMDLGPEFRGRSAGAGPASTSGPAGSNAAAAPAQPTHADQRIHPAAGTPAPAAATSPATPAGADGMNEQGWPPFGLADTHPAGLAPFEPAEPPAAVEVAGAQPATPVEPAPSAQPAQPAAAGAQPATAPPQSGEFPEPHQTTFWPPDGVL